MLLSLHLALQALSFSDVEDAELVELYLVTRGDRYFGELYRRYSPKVYGKCITMLNNEAEAADAVQDIFERVLLRIGSFRQDSKFGTWLFTITNNFCIDVLRKRKRLRGKVGEMPDIDIEDVVEESDWLQEQSPLAIRHILDNLPELDRVALVLMYMDELSVKEIAVQMGLQESATKMRLKRARQRAKNIYDVWKSDQNAYA
ncbi:MAG: RNA polymerase sigma factor [Saprospiraceae bacterium]